MKKNLCLLLSVLLLFVFAVPSYATNGNNKKDIQEEVTKLAKKYGFELFELDKNSPVTTIESLEELEHYFKELRKLEKKQHKIIINKKPMDKNESLGLKSITPLADTTYDDTHTFKWWNPFAGFDGLTLLCWSNVYIEYTYKFVNSKPQFVSLDKCDSYLSGITISWWKQIGYDGDITTANSINDTMEVAVNGKYVLGVSIGGFTIGASRNATWDVSLTLK